MTSWPEVVRFTVEGEPIPQGSVRVFGGRVVHDNPRTKGWRALVAAEAAEVVDGDPWVGPVAATLVFRVQKPRTAPRRRTFPTVRPDLDKYGRAVLDALTGLVWVDDSQVVRLTLAKVYAQVDEPIGLVAEVRRVAS